ncbi:hypothetical protein AVEN_69630-1 [Araneus ventricosus]|uniref:PEP-utilising enzyme mobile domain-containing protein n=1 Tax=Araneus ventricosus TaxID=182803 RepID=A0A4Y2EXW6_ARAVE|nr:hypothetical protein AVEN_69630-1 [Araneus ventricosus]
MSLSFVNLQPSNPTSVNICRCFADEEYRKGQQKCIMTFVQPPFIKAMDIDTDTDELSKPGEILVTYSTDIGWSPYFPILGGVVTELGGLISHGAVVSREYGLPCIAGLHGATQQFKTGDYVLLDGNKGILQKLPKPEDS